VYRLENGTANEPSAARIQAAMEAAGVEFTNGGEPGVKMRANDSPAPFASGD
jgi:hypothetical protein